MIFYELFLKPYESYTTFQIFLEFIAATFGMLSVYFSIKKNIWVYPTGIISTTLYVYILFVFLRHLRARALLFGVNCAF